MFFARNGNKLIKKGENMKKFLAFSGFALLGVSAFAGQIFGSDVSLDTSPVIAMAGIVVAAIASIWAIKKVIALGNKS
jgi:hypothetical protein